MYRRAKDQTGTVIRQLFLPRAPREKILKGFHDQSGHQGRDRTERLIQSKCYWPHMATDIRNWVSCCDRCVLAKKTLVRPPIGTITASRPLEVIAIDFTILEKSKDGRENELVIADICSKFTLAIPTRD